jgi:hypothetical protein
MIFAIRSDVPVPEGSRLGLVQIDEPLGWWVTVDGRPAIGFTGNNAQHRAEQYFSELIQIATDSVGRGLASAAAALRMSGRKVSAAPDGPALLV